MIRTMISGRDTEMIYFTQEILEQEYSEREMLRQA